jgi:hypothetical protein
MYYSFNVPFKYLETFYDYQDLFFFDMDDARDERYAKFCRTLRKPVMLFGMTKKGGVSTKQLLAKGEELRATELVVPFVPNDGKKSYGLAYHFFKELEKRALQNKFEIMVVPQGKTQREFFVCALAMSRLPIKTLGLYLRPAPGSKLYAMEQKRFNLIKQLVERGILKGKHVHLLELYGIQFLKAYKKGGSYFKIRSVNTNYPLLSALSGKTFNETKRRVIFDVNEDITLSKETVTKIKHNMEFIRTYK